MDVIVGKKTETVDANTVRAKIAPYSGVLVDIGTGSGRFVYEVARRHPDFFCIGIDAVPKKLHDYSSKIHRRTARGGVENAMLVRAAVERLPIELAGMATHITVNLPWGSLLHGIVLAQPEVLRNILSIAAPGVIIEFLLSYSALYEPYMMASLGLPDLTTEYLEQHLKTVYAQQGISIHEVDALDNVIMKGFPSDCGRRLAHGRKRQFIHVLARVHDTTMLQQSQKTQPPSIIHELLG